MSGAEMIADTRRARPQKARAWHPEGALPFGSRLNVAARPQRTRTRRPGRAWHPGQAWQLALVLLAGCGGDARVELSAADALRAVAGSMDTAIQEYHQEVCQFDEAREASVVSAFVTRVRQAPADEAKVDTHAAEFQTALRKIRQDREAEWRRRSAAMDNVGVLTELAKGLQKIGLQSLSLQDEMRRYLESWLEVRQRAERAGAGARSADANVGR